MVRASAETLFSMYKNNKLIYRHLIFKLKSKISLKQMVTKVLPLSKFREAVDLVEHGGTSIIKVVLHPWED